MHGSTNRHGRWIDVLWGMFVGVLLSLCFLSNNSDDDIDQLVTVKFVGINDHYLTNSTTIHRKKEGGGDGVDNAEIDTTPVHEKLRDEIRVLCWVLTYPGNHQIKAAHVKKTWGRRCTKLLFMSNERGLLRLRT